MITIQVNDVVRGYKNNVGVVFDVFSCRGALWAMVEWRVRGNQYTKSPPLCKVHRCDVLKIVRGVQSSGLQTLPVQNQPRGHP